MKQLLVLSFLFIAGCTDLCRQYEYHHVKEIITCRLGSSESTNCVYKDENGVYHRKGSGDLSVGATLSECVKY